MSIAALEAENARLQAEIDRLRHALGDFNERIVCGQLTGKLPDNFLEQFSQLPDRPLEQVLRFLPTRQVPQMRRVSRKFNNVIRKGSKSMPKKESKGSVVFKSCNTGELTVELRDCKSKFLKTTLADDGVALTELFRFIRIGGWMYFGEGLSAADKVLDQLSKAWLTIRPNMVIFAGDLSQTSRDSLRAFLVKVEPSIMWLHFQYANNIGNLLSDDLIGAAGRLDGLMVTPACGGLRLRNINISDETLLAMVDADHVPSYLYFMGCSGITLRGIRAFIESALFSPCSMIEYSSLKKWMKQESQTPDNKAFNFGGLSKFCELSFYNCANVAQAAVREACRDLLKKETIAGANTSSVDDSRESDRYVGCSIQFLSNNRCLDIIFHYKPFLIQIMDDPRVEYLIDSQIAVHDLDPETEGDNDEIDVDN